MTTTTEEPVRLLSEQELLELPALSIIRSTGINPHAWQKRQIFTSLGPMFFWYATTDADWGDSTETILRDNDGFVLLWTPQP